MFSNGAHLEAEWIARSQGDLRIFGLPNGAPRSRLAQKAR